MISEDYNCYGQGRFFCSGTHDWKLLTENGRYWSLLWLNAQPPPQQKTQKFQTGCYLRGPKNWEKDAEGSFFTLDGFGGGEGCSRQREDSVFFKGLATGSLNTLQRVCRQHKVNLVYFVGGTSGRNGRQVWSICIAWNSPKINKNMLGGKRTAQK